MSHITFQWTIVMAIRGTMGSQTPTTMDKERIQQPSCVYHREWIL